MLNALAQYGAALDADGFITKNGKTLSIKFVVLKGRLRAEDKTGNLVASFPNKPESVHSFVQKYWFWELPKVCA